METSPAPAAPATDMEPATLFVALELSKAKWLVGLHSPTADKISRHTITGGDAPALLGLIEAARRRAEASLGGEVQVVTCYEAGYDGFWLHRLLLAHGIANQVVDPASRQGPRAPDHGGGTGAQADRRSVALSGQRHCAGRCLDAGVSDEIGARQQRFPMLQDGRVT